jgi:beta-glucanase (GH16 family)
LLTAATFLVQTMYFVNGLRVPVHNAAEDIYVATDTSQSQHTYGMEYTPNTLTWFLDGKIVRTVQKLNGTQYPSKPMGLHLGLWDASQFSEWAGTVRQFITSYFNLAATTTNTVKLGKLEHTSSRRSFSS